jgi:hypothetical protein
MTNKFNLGKFLFYLFAFIIVVVIVVLGTGCNIQKKIEEAKKEAVRADRAEKPCANDTIFKLVPGDSIITLQTVHTKSTDTLFNWTYDTAYITKTVHQIDTLKVFVRDNYKINALNDSLNAHRQAEANLQGQIIQEKLNTVDANKLAKNRLAIIIAIISFIALICGVGIYFKFFTAAGGLKSFLK